MLDLLRLSTRSNIGCWICYDQSMVYREEKPVVGEYYHVFNRGVEKRSVFSDARDYQRFTEIARYYLDSDPPISFSQRARMAPEIQHRVLDYSEGLVEVVCYCLMPNHFHFLVRVVKDQGLETWVRRMINSYTRSFNTRSTRVGSLFQGPYKIVHVSSNEQLLHLSRYIHLNCVVAGLCPHAEDYRYSSMGLYLKPDQPSWINSSIVLDQFSSPADYQRFVADHVSYALDLDRIKHLLLEDE